MKIVLTIIKKILDTGIDIWKTASKKVVQKAAEATAEFKGNKIPDALAQLNDGKIVKQ